MEHKEMNSKEKVDASAAAGKARGRRKAHPHLLTFTLAVIVVWGLGTYIYTYFYPLLIYNALEKAIVQHGIDALSWKVTATWPRPMGWRSRSS